MPTTISDYYETESTKEETAIQPQLAFDMGGIPLSN
jgi:hypothetical protein